MSDTPGIIVQVRAAGGRIMIIEDRLKVRAPLPLPDKLVAELRLHKAEVLAFLQDRKPAWTPEDWQAHFDERSGIAEHDGGLPRANAEQQAFQCCVVEWLWRNPPPASGPERCAYCGEPLSEAGADGDQVNFPGLPYLTGNGGHTWLHTGCHGDWTVLRRAEAVAALLGYGLTPPDNYAIGGPLALEK